MAAVLNGQFWDVRKHLLWRPFDFLLGELNSCCVWKHIHQIAFNKRRFDESKSQVVVRRQPSTCFELYKSIQPGRRVKQRRQTGFWYWDTGQCKRRYLVYWRDCKEFEHILRRQSVDEELFVSAGLDCCVIPLFVYKSKGLKPISKWKIFEYIIS